MFPKEIIKLYNELRNLTEEVKNYYAYHAMLTIFYSILIFISNVTALTLDYTNEMKLSISHNFLFLVYCVLKMSFLFFIVRETHKTVQEVITYPTVSRQFAFQHYYYIRISKSI